MIELRECPHYVAHPQSVWFNEHWRPIIEKLKARLLDFEGQTYSENEEIKKLKAELKQVIEIGVEGQREINRKAHLENVELKVEIQNLKDFFMESLQQACGMYDEDTQSYSYDHMCLSTYEHMVAYALKNGWITKEQVIR